MKKIKKLIKVFGVIIILSLIVSLFSPTWTQHIRGDNSISVLKQVEINGSRHEIMIRGKNKDNPVIIVVHGGPGTPEIPNVDQYQDYWKPILRSFITIKEQVVNHITFLKTILIFQQIYWLRIYWL